MGMIGISNTPLRLRHCDACGEMRVIHPLEKFLSWVEEYTEHESARVVPVYKQNAKSAYARARLMMKLKLGTLHANANHSVDSRVHALYEGAAAEGLTLLDYEFLGKHISYFLLDESGSVLQFVHLPHELLPYHAPICIDDKYALAQFLIKQQLQVPQTWLVKSVSDTSLLDIHCRPLVVKPCIGTRGRHTTLHHDSLGALKEGIRLALQVSTRVVIQEELQGTVYRFTVVGGRSVYAAKREYPHVIGDGKLNIAELVSAENKNPLRDGVYFKKMPFGEHEKEFLKSKGISEVYIPAQGELCVISDKNSRRNGTVIEDITHEVHPNIQEYVRTAARLLQSPILGFDVILESHEVSLTEQHGGIIECNSVPYLDVHHRVVRGKQYNVAAELLKLVSKEYHLRGKLPS